ncbi:hypothetical protein FNF29_00015 [Cafeteria roenbergensis]|uniref:Transmembrane protein 19 n=1 Tax=Cafeteria roenbergensis TaxID=33653 RepID=A0A5A8CXM4_CAFRO|nr:hypothetical protein FNF29_00015 [Cafeteria roenbergensis]|eukprot:KAA0157439.1 hypothetical protein FNF29_00015 [Cafeteria roenbergensis]
MEHLELSSWFWIRCAAGLVIAGAMAGRGLKRGSLSKSGAAAALLVGFGTLAASWRFGLVLIGFYFSSTILTRIGTSKKKEMERGFKEGGQRDAWQVLTNSGIALALSVAHVVLLGTDGDAGPQGGPLPAPTAALVKSLVGHATALPDECAAAALRTALLCAIVGHFACACGDTWASELGVLSPCRPRLVTSCCLRVVPPGTNGGVSFLGTAASCAGGLFVGALASVLGAVTGCGAAWELLPAVGAACGFVGSMVDSGLGATLQETVFVAGSAGSKGGRIVALDSSADETAAARRAGHTQGFPVLSNNAVNFVSVAVSTLLAAAVGAVIGATQFAGCTLV